VHFVYSGVKDETCAIRDRLTSRPPASRQSLTLCLCVGDLRKVRLVVRRERSVAFYHHGT